MNERLKLVAKDLYYIIFETFDDDPDLDGGNDAGFIADQAHRAIMEALHTLLD